MYAFASMPFVSRTRATFRSAEFGFLGVTVDTRVQTPRRWGAPCRWGVFVFAFFETRPFRISWLTLVMELQRRVLTQQRPAAQGQANRSGHGSRASHWR